MPQKTLAKRALALASALLCLSFTPAFAGGHRHHSSLPIPPSVTGNAAGPNDEGGHDYARPIGSSSAPTLSTGWTSGHGTRTEEVHDYLRHTKSGRVVHVHGYYRSHR